MLKTVLLIVNYIMFANLWTTYTRLREPTHEKHLYIYKNQLCTTTHNGTTLVSTRNYYNYAVIKFRDIFYRFLSEILERCSVSRRETNNCQKFFTRI